MDSHTQSTALLDKVRVGEKVRFKAEPCTAGAVIATDIQQAK
jgi:hypothetical protein